MPLWLVLTAVAQEPATSVQVIEVEPSRYPPLRLALRGALRSDLNVGPVIELGIQLWSSSRWKMDFNLTSVSQGIAVPGPPRGMNQWNFGLDLLAVISKQLEVGPVFAASHRVFRQQFTTQSRFWIPVVGGRASVPVLFHRRWSWTTDVVVTADIANTTMVFEDQEVRDLSPVQVQVGQRFNLGHGRRVRYAEDSDE